ncbi:protein NETWORKED 4A-like [Salvia miltiorrhiza]|uniref:protein NETWORKED 4A-like n=1 Tax=Salvia miltiorrhiza TaxID=226208 RepID=UPI0025AC50F0|nr:protein NETWORKED 4A-like [Salvia miltiorrhiza]XP_057772607.1 protein NETWORKED 4A-like [Salvia miltiorrhiza]XP_057772608.1 protein NETWORKED 4A-like [Salvia miltiorrhiza]XP_057772609.1 protein NETWORKED 4A-like [Salvia miltiorrhiza]XP_057772610.1 protein NETWORKED 4A-like [Salvia miltiorrhiza]XP_057772611.1 protein NETWORKED 4A-like [Salvia miltiorrhiza]
MSSSHVKYNKMKRLESKKSHSWWWDSHVSPKNSKWLQENLDDMDQNVKRMLKLIEEDADSFAKKAELYFKKRPELVGLVEEFYRMYRALAERYDHVTGELKKNIPSDLRSQGSGVSDVGSEPPFTVPSPDTKPARTKSGPRAAGFEFFLGSNGSGSDLNSKEGDESSTLDSESESDDSSVNNYSSTQSNSEEVGSRRRVIELEAELHEVKEKLRLQTEEISIGSKQCSHECSEINLAKLAAYEEELRVAKENMEESKEEIARLKIELQKYESVGDSNDMLSSGVAVEKDSETHESSIVLEQHQATELQENNGGSEGEVGLEHKIRRLEQELRSAEKKLRESAEEVASLRQELSSKGSSAQNLQDQLKLAQKEVAVWKNKVEREKRDASRLQDRVVRYKTNLSERDQEIRGLKESIGNANKALAEENEHLQAEMTRMTKERAYLEDNLKEMDLRCQSLEEDMRRVKSAKDEAEAVFGARIEQLKADIAERDDRVEELSRNLDEWKVKHDTLAAARDELSAKIAALGAEISSRDDHLQQLHLQHVQLIVSAEEARKSAEELRSRIVELEMDVERKQETILEGAEEKREAIRQLCLSIEHYRSGYHQLRQAVVGQQRPTVMAR